RPARLTTGGGGGAAVRYGCRTRRGRTHDERREYPDQFPTHLAPPLPQSEHQSASPSHWGMCLIESSRASQGLPWPSCAYGRYRPSAAQLARAKHCTFGQKTSIDGHSEGKKRHSTPVRELRPRLGRTCAVVHPGDRSPEGDADGGDRHAARVEEACRSACKGGSGHVSDEGGDREGGMGASPVWSASRWRVRPVATFPRDLP